MDIMEIVLLAAGGVVFILSFLIPLKKEEGSEETRGLAKEEIKALVSEELEVVRGHVDDVVEEAVTYSIEKTERSLERLSNEKIMAVNEYSDTVLAEIHKNHEEVMFLYDMLNDKHINLKNTVSEVNRTVQEVKETKKEAEEVVNTFQRLAPKTVIPLKAPVPVMPPQVFAAMPQESVQPVVPPIFASAQQTQPVPMAQQQAVPSAQQTQSVPMAQQQAVPSAQQTRPVPMAQQQAVPSAQQTQPASMAQQQAAPSAQQMQPVSRQVDTGSHQTLSVSSSPSPVPQKVSPASRRMSPTPQKVSFPVSKREATTPQTVAVSTREFTTPVLAAAGVPQPSPSGTVSGSGTLQTSGVINFAQETDSQGRNYNDRILELYKNGKSNVAIARELNLGVGEVKLVIDLYKNRSEK